MLSENKLDRERHTVCFDLYVESKKYTSEKKTSEYNKKEADTDIEKKLVITSGEREGGRGNIRAGEKEVQTIMYKINYKDILYNTGNIANIL